MEGSGIVYARGSRWKQMPNGGYVLTFGGGDRPEFRTETVVDFLHRAMVDLVHTFGECVDFYATILAAHAISMNGAGEVTVRL